MNIFYRRSQKERIIPRRSWIPRSIREQSIRTEVNSKLLINASLARRSDERDKDAARSRGEGMKVEEAGEGGEARATSFNLEAGKKVGWYLETRICKVIAARIIEAQSYILFPFLSFLSFCFLSEIEFVSRRIFNSLNLICLKINKSRGLFKLDYKQSEYCLYNSET